MPLLPASNTTWQGTGAAAVAEGGLAAGRSPAHEASNSTDAVVDQMADEVKAFAARLSQQNGLDVKIELVSSYPAQGFHSNCIDAVARAAQKLGYSNMPVVSGAGHDAVYMAKLAPSGMIFIPCKNGISHNEIEDAKAEHITAGCNVLLHAMLERAGT